MVADHAEASILAVAEATELQFVVSSLVFHAQTWVADADATTLRHAVAALQCLLLAADAMTLLVAVAAVVVEKSEASLARFHVHFKVADAVTLLVAAVAS